MEKKNNNTEFYQMRLTKADMRRLSFLAIRKGQSKAAVVRDLVRKATEELEREEQNAN